MTLIDQFIDIWQNIFIGERKFMFFVGFCMLTFAVPFLLVWLSGGVMQLYSFIILRRKYPVEWLRLIRLSNKGRHVKVFKKWMKNKPKGRNPFFKLWYIHDMLGKVFLAIWFIIVLAVGITALAINYV